MDKEIVLIRRLHDLWLYRFISDDEYQRFTTMLKVERDLAEEMINNLYIEYKDYFNV